jgi:hypothetical protein
VSAVAVTSIVGIFSSRLTTLEALLAKGSKHFLAGDESFLGLRLADDMHPLGTQIAFTCNQPRNFALWSNGVATEDLDPDVKTIELAFRHIKDTKALLASVTARDSILDSPKRLELGSTLYAELTGRQYVDDFLMPNFYFHLVTAYGILRMSGVEVGKRDYMLHLVPFVRQSAA